MTTETDGLNVTQAAAFLGVSRTTVYALLKANKIPHVVIGTQPRFSRTALTLWMGGAQLAGLMARIAALAASAAPTPPTAAPTTPPGRLTPKHIGARRRTNPLRITDIATRARPEVTSGDPS